MFSFSRILVTAALAVSALAAAPVPTRTTRGDVLSVNPVGIVTRPVPQKPAVALTNAQRLARGLPPNRPRARYGRRGQALQPRQSSTTVVQRGYIGALSVSFSPGAGATFDIAATNGASAFDYLGVAAFPNTGDQIQLDDSTFNYAFLAGVPQEPRGPAVLADNSFSAATDFPVYVESNVWALGADSELVPSWVNSDGSLGSTVAAYWYPGDNTFILTGNLAWFRQSFGSDAAHPVTFKLVIA